MYVGEIMFTMEYVHRGVLNILLKHKIKAKRYLDIGCGDAVFTLKIAETVKASEIYGIDISKKDVKKPIKILQIDIHKEKLPFFKEYFDLVTAIDVIEHLPYGDNLVKNCYFILKSGGYFILSTPNLSNWINRLLLMFGYQPRGGPQPSSYLLVGLPYRPYPSPHKHFLHKIPEPYCVHLCGYTLKGLCDLLSYYGFNIIDKRGVPLPFKHFRLLNYLEKIFSKIPSLAGEIIVLVQKV